MLACVIVGLRAKTRELKERNTILGIECDVYQGRIDAVTSGRWEFYKDKRKEWRWKRIANNNKITHASTEGFKNRVDCVDNATQAAYKI